jgi:hypothetical protein
METNFKIPLLNEPLLVGIGYYNDYLNGYKKGNKISARINLDYALDLFDNAVPSLIDPNTFMVRINEIQIELCEFYTTIESRMIVNLFKKIISSRLSSFLGVDIGSNGVEILSYDNLIYWEYIIDDSIYDLYCVEYIDYFNYKGVFTYVTELHIIEYDDDMNETDSFTYLEVMTDQIQDYWDVDIEKKIHLKKLESNCFTEVILTFDFGQEISNLYMPFERLSNSTLFSDYILNTEVRSSKRRKALRKISTYIIPTINQIDQIGEAYYEFLEWYLPCWGKFYFNEDDK